MARIYALLQPDGDLLTARARGDGWHFTDSLQGVDSNGRNLTVFLNGIDVLGLTAQIPARNEREVRRAAPFAVEEEIAESVEDSHVALSDTNQADATTARELNVISDNAMRDVVEQLARHGLDEAEIVAAHNVLPRRDMIYEAPGLVLGRLGGRAFALDPALGRDVLIGIAEPYQQVEIYGVQVARAIGREAQGSGAATLEALLGQLATWAESGHATINLRQGMYVSRAQIDMEGLGRWKMTGALAAIAVLAWFGSVVLEINAMNSRTNGLETLSQEFARVGWPELNGDVRQAIAAAQGANQGTTQSFISLLDATAVLYDAIDQIDGSELRTLRYDRVRRQMTATVAFQSFADVDRLTAILNTTGVTARSGDARQSGSKVIGDLTLEAAT